MLCWETLDPDDDIIVLTWSDLRTSSARCLQLNVKQQGWGSAALKLRPWYKAETMVDCSSELGVNHCSTACSWQDCCASLLCTVTVAEWGWGAGEWVSVLVCLWGSSRDSNAQNHCLYWWSEPARWKGTGLWRFINHPQPGDLSS